MRKRMLLSVAILLFLLGGMSNMGLPRAVDAENAKMTPTPGDTVSVRAASAKEQKPGNLESIQAALKSGRPTLAFVYYSVACSCTAAHCAIAEAALDSAVSAQSLAGKVNVLKVDGYTEESADSIFKVEFVPLVVYYDDKGEEASRIQWDISKEMVEILMAGKTAVKDIE